MLCIHIHNIIIHIDNIAWRWILAGGRGNEVRYETKSQQKGKQNKRPGVSVEMDQKTGQRHDVPGSTELSICLIDLT